MCTSPLTIAFPLLTALTSVTIFQSFSALLIHLCPKTFPIEWGDVYSLQVSSLLSLYYYLNSAQTPRQTLLLICVQLWSLRLSLFLSRRNLSGFVDRRLDRLRNNVAGAKKWMIMQTAWITLSLLPIWIGMSESGKPEWKGLDVIGFGTYVVGLVIETVADEQKTRWRKEKKKGDKGVCMLGLFGYSRFANYFGEWLVWTGLCLVVWGSMMGWIRVFLPVCTWFVWSILYRLSIPLGVEDARKRLSREEFEKWCAISLFVPIPR